jgi:hypothetical protein
MLSAKISKSLLSILNDTYDLELKSEKRSGKLTSDKEFPTIKLTVNLRTPGLTPLACKDATKVIKQCVAQSLSDFERQAGWLLKNCQDRFHIAKFSKHALDVPRVLADYFERQNPSFDKESFIDELTGMILKL